MRLPRLSSGLTQIVKFASYAGRSLQTAVCLYSSTGFNSVVGNSAYWANPEGEVSRLKRRHWAAVQLEVLTNEAGGFQD